MNKFNETIKEIKNISMTTEEKSRMRAQISMFVAKHPVGVPVRSPWHMNKLLEGAVFLTLGLFVGVSGLTFFATKANPGDALYPLKSVLIKPIPIETISPSSTETSTFMQAVEKIPDTTTEEQIPSRGNDSMTNNAPIVTTHMITGKISVTNVCGAAHKGTCPTYVFENTSASIRASDGTIISTDVDAMGNFQKTLPEGSYTVILPPIGDIRTNTEKLIILSKDSLVSFNFTNTVR